MESAQEQVLLDLLRSSLGVQVLSLMSDPLTTDLVINPDERVFVKRQGQTWANTGFTRPAAMTRAAAMTAGTLARAALTEQSPYLAVQVPGFGWRMTAVVEPVVKNTTIALRKPAPAIYSLETYLEEGRISDNQYRALFAAVTEKKGRNVLVAGATGSGKTTLVNALVALIGEHCPTQRLLILEDTEEIQCSVENATSMLVCGSNTMAAAVEQVMRLIPTRIVVGELRGGAATAATLRAWGTGHGGGVTTIHAGSAKQALAQLEDYVADLPGSGLRRTQIAERVHFVVYIEERRVEQVLRVHNELDEMGRIQWEEIEK